MLKTYHLRPTIGTQINPPHVPLLWDHPEDREFNGRPNLTTFRPSLRSYVNVCIVRRIK